MPTPLEMEQQAPGRMDVTFVRNLPKNNSFTISNWVNDHVIQTRDGKEEVEALFLKETKKYIEIKDFRRKQLVNLFGNQEVIGKQIRVTLNDRDWICIEAADNANE